MWLNMPHPFFTAFFKSEILEYGFLSMKESLYMPRIDLLEYKLAKMEYFLETPKPVQCTEMPRTHAQIVHTFCD